MPDEYPKPGADKKVIALAWVAITDKHTLYHGMAWFPNKYPLIFSVPRLLYIPYTTINKSVQISTAQSRLLMKSIG